MRVLVIGGAGYIGSHIVRLLHRNDFNVIVYDNLSTGHTALVEGYDLVIGDIGDCQALAKILRGVDAVMHFAAYACVGESICAPRKYFRTNVESSLVLLNCVIDAGIRYFVFSSSCAVYGIPTRIPIVESTPRVPISPYGASKLFFENALEAYDRAYGLRFVSLRYFNAAGADESGRIGEIHSPETHAIPLALASARGTGPPFSLYGTDYPTPDGTCVRDYIHVSDLAAGHMAALDYILHGHPSIQLNLGTGKGHSLRQVISMVDEMTGLRVPVVVAPRRPGDPAELVADTSRAKEVLGWEATRSLRDIIETAWRWAQNRDDIMYRTKQR